MPVKLPVNGDFTSPAACRELTRVLLKKDFDVEWWVPDGHLVPPLTNRLNYIHWLQDVLALSPPPGTAPAADPLSLSDPLSLQPRNHAHLPDLSGPGKPHNTAFKKSGRVRSWTAKQIAPQTDPAGGLT